MALQVPKVLHDRLALYVLKHLLGMVWEVGLVAMECQESYCTSVWWRCVSMLNHEKDWALSIYKKVDVANGKVY